MVLRIRADLDVQRDARKETTVELEYEAVPSRLEGISKVRDATVSVGHAARYDVAVPFERDRCATSGTAGRRIQNVSGEGRHGRPVSYAAR